MGKQTKIALGEDRNSKAAIDAILNKNRCDANSAEIREGDLKQTNSATFNSIINYNRFPNIERITHSLRKVQEITKAAHLLWSTEKTARKISTDAIEIINKVCQRKFSFLNGKSLRCLVGGLFYLLGFRYDDPKKQREIAIVLQITDVSIRSSYKQWLKEFPDLLRDIIAKFRDQPLHHNCYLIVQNSGSYKGKTAFKGATK